VFLESLVVVVRDRGVERGQKYNPISSSHCQHASTEKKQEKKNCAVPQANAISNKP